MTETEMMEQLHAACRCALRRDLRGYWQLLERVRAAIRQQETSNALRGEWILAASLQQARNLDALCGAYREALSLLNGPSRLLPQGAHLFGDAYNVYAICNVEPGRGGENAEKLEQAVNLFGRLTGGGKGTDICYRAQLAYYRGELGSARTLAREAFLLARQNGQGLVALCAAETLAGVARHRQDTGLWNFAAGYIAAVAEGSQGDHRACREQAQILRCILDLSVGVLQSVPAWIQAGDFGAISAPWGFEMAEDKILGGTLPDAMIVRLQYDSYRGRPVRALETADAMYHLYGMHDVILDAYLDFFRAGCYLCLGDRERVRETLESAVARIAPDGLWLIAAEFAPAFGGLLDSALAKADACARARVQALGEGYWHKLTPFRQALLRGASGSLTRREREISALVAQGLTNAEIAARLSIRERTVKSHVTSIFSKYNVFRRGQLAEAVKKLPETPQAFWTL